MNGPIPTIAIAGNPNCGKTTLFNALTGLRYKVANYPGVTVERKIGKLSLPDFPDTSIIDIPGIYSLAGSSEDEQIATAVLLGSFRNEPAPDCLVAVLDSTNLERNLYLVTQFIDCGIPLLIALNMVDLAEQKGIRVFKELLSKQLDVPVVSIVASKGEGLDALRAELNKLLKERRVSSKRFGWLPADTPYREAAQTVGTAQAPAADADSKPGALFVGSGLLAETTFPRDPIVAKALADARKTLTDSGIDSFSFEATKRYSWINAIVRRSSSIEERKKTGLSEKVDALCTHRIWGCVIFIAIMAIIFQSIFLWSQVPMDLIESAMGVCAEFISARMTEGPLKSLVVDGILAGVGNVLVFVPQIAVLFLFLGALEDSGYLSRAAFVMDRLMRPVGLQGRSFIPLLSSFACAIPGIMATRTIPSRSDRLTTILVAPLMSCSARLPVYTVLIAACIPQRFIFGFVSLQGLMLLTMYALGVAGAALVAWLMKLSVLRGEPALFVMEMPPIRAPLPKVVLRDMVDRVTAFLKSASTIILACSIVLWFLASYPKPPAEHQGSALQYSAAGRIGMAMEPVIKPLGFNWEVGVGILASFAAREVFVSALATVYNLEDSDDNTDSLIEILQRKNSEGTFTTLSAISLMVFYVFACQCMSTLAVCRRETNSWRWTAFMFFYMTGLAYLASLATYQLGKLWVA